MERLVGSVERGWRWWLASLLLAEGLLLLYMGRGLTFFFDDWDFVTHDYGGGLHSLLVAHVGNISVLPVAIYKVMFHLVGIGSYVPYRAMVVVLHLIIGGLVFVLASRRVARAPALLATALVLFLGAAWEDLLWAFQVGYLLSIVGGVGAWVLLERRDRLGDVGALLCLLVATGSSSLAIPLLIGVTVELAFRRNWSRLWIVAVPVVLYALWYLHYGESQVTEGSLIAAPGFAADLAAAAFGGLIGRGLEWGRPLALLGVLAVAVRLVRPGPVSPRLVGLLAAGLSLWAVTAATRSTISAPETSRYIYLGAVVIVLVGVELLDGIAVSTRVVGVTAGLVGVAAITGLTVMHNGAQGLRGTSETVKSELGALQLAPAAPAGFQIDPQRAPQIQAGPYLHTARSIGSSPADTPAQIVAADPVSRAAADQVLIELGAADFLTSQHSRPSPLAPAPTLVSTGAAKASQRAGCLELSPPTQAGMMVALLLPSGGVEIKVQGGSTPALALRRFGDSFHPLAVTSAPGGGDLRIAPDGVAVPWQLQLSSAAPVSVCGLSA
jgi:hypothetical protein